MTIKQRIVTYLQRHPEGIDDDELASVLDLKSRQQANQRCRELEREGLIVRRQVNGKIHNFWMENGAGFQSLPSVSKSQKPQKALPKAKFENWYWEGNVQAKAVSHLVTQGYYIRSVADTASHQSGIDIVAEKDGRQLWVSVKGYPQGTEKTNPSLQAAHWFKHAVFDMVEYRERDKNADLAVALPDFPRYHTLAQKITWFKQAAGFRYLWVKEDGGILVE